MYKYVEADLPDVGYTPERCQITDTNAGFISADGELIAQFGEKRRIPLTLSQIPPMVRRMPLSRRGGQLFPMTTTESTRSGFSVPLLLPATSGRASQGASTITQQLARNFFLSPEKPLSVKVKEAFLAIRIEQMLTKDEILELYLNKIYLASALYGVGLRLMSISAKKP